MESILDPNNDPKIRQKLSQLDQQNRLLEVSQASGIAGGVKELRRLMSSTEPLSIMDRGMLHLHLRRIK